MSQNNEEQKMDPAGSTQMFRRFVSDNNEPEAAPKRPVTPYVLAAVGVVVAVGIILTVVLTWS